MAAADIEIEQSDDRRSRSREKLATLVQSRSETLSLFTELAKQRPFRPDPITMEALQEFCQALIDYTASAHFQLYRYIADRLERRTAVLEVANRVYPRIAQTTDTILRFNDKYEDLGVASKVSELFSVLDSDLSHLGEALAERIQLEDEVIGALVSPKH